MYENSFAVSCLKRKKGQGKRNEKDGLTLNRQAVYNGREQRRKEREKTWETP